MDQIQFLTQSVVNGAIKNNIEEFNLSPTERRRVIRLFYKSVTEDEELQKLLTEDFKLLKGNVPQMAGIIIRGVAKIIVRDLIAPLLTQSFIKGNALSFFGRQGVTGVVNGLDTSQKSVITELANEVDMYLYTRASARYLNSDAGTQNIGLAVVSTAVKQASKASAQIIKTLSDTADNILSAVMSSVYLGKAKTPWWIILLIQVVNAAMIAYVIYLDSRQRSSKNELAGNERKNMAKVQDMTSKGSVYRTFAEVDGAIRKIMRFLTKHKNDKSEMNKNLTEIELQRIALKSVLMIGSAFGLFVSALGGDFISVLKSGEVPVGSIATLASYADVLASIDKQFSTLSISIPKLVSALKDLDEVSAYLNIKPKIVDADGASDLDLSKIKDGEPILAFKNVSFAYPPPPDLKSEKKKKKKKPEDEGDSTSEEKEKTKKQKLLFHNANFVIKKGEHVAIQAESGLGKSSIAALLLREYDVFPFDNTDDHKDDGVYVGGKNVRTDLTQNSLRKNICYVSPNNNEFIPGSIRDHFKLANPDVTDEQIIKILENLGLLDAVKRNIMTKKGESKSDASNPLDDKTISAETILDTKLALRDFFQFSSGEKRRLIIARGLVSAAPIIIWDEPTNAIDEVWRKKVIDLIKKKNEGKTAIIISHNEEDVKTLAESIIPLSKNENKNEDNYGSTIVGGRFKNKNNKKKNEEEDKDKIIEEKNETIAKLMKFIVKMQNGQELTAEENAELEELKKKIAEIEELQKEKKKAELEETDSEVMFTTGANILEVSMSSDKSDTYLNITQKDGR